ncbi:uncharacterized protein LOC107884888 [Acyrthosiphon pisum]|uniref:Uncharacterized protein n=1 Tax=Acyrthosiphon pisum TaxID=7029 RepID=A0A8R2D6B2_ACYPI|nr:uncharacterized protein LOC107884888 [Acyrthosiphon pisum]|eukprot:XP_016663435.1 PREDICTED: uncharacterized protein LOC107884888 isoform X2 [Acyrthosiphon pisum]
MCSSYIIFQLKELDHVRFHMRTHRNIKEPENSILNLTVATALTPVPQQKKQLYRFEIFSKCFDSQINWLDHIQKHNNQPTAPVKKLQIVLRKNLMKTIRMWKKNGRLGHVSCNP